MFAFITAQRAPRRRSRVVRLEDGEPGLSARTIKRRLASISGLYEYLVLRGEVVANPVPRGLAVRPPGQRVIRGVPLIRTPRTLPRIIEPSDVGLLLATLRTQRDQAMVLAMLLGGCGAVKYSVSASRICNRVSGGSLSAMARVAISG